MTITHDEKPAKLDVWLLALALALTCGGILLVFDASYAFAVQHHISPYKYVRQQAGFGAFGIFCLVALSYFPYWRYKRIAGIVLALSLTLLVLVLMPHIGTVAKGAHRWLGHGFFRFQPSELAKLGIILFVARSCAAHMKLMPNFLAGPFPSLVGIVLLAALTAVQPDLGTATVIAGTGLITLFFAGMKKRHLLAVMVALTLMGALVIGIKATREHNSYQLNRILVFLHPEEEKQGDGYQIWHSTVALGTGGVLGLGVGQGREKLYLPEAHTDFIFAVLGEEGGLVTGLVLLTLFGLLVARGMQIACATQDPFGALLAAGISASLGLQVLINIGVVTDSMPATGVPLPFLSYGGTSLVLSLGMVGMLLNIARNPLGDPKKLPDKTLANAAREFERRWDKSASRRSGDSSARVKPSRVPAARS